MKLVNKLKEKLLKREFDVWSFSANSLKNKIRLSDNGIYSVSFLNESILSVVSRTQLSDSEDLSLFLYKKNDGVLIDEREPKLLVV